MRETAGAVAGTASVAGLQVCCRALQSLRLVPALLVLLLLVPRVVLLLVVVVLQLFQLLLVLLLPLVLVLLPPPLALPPLTPRPFAAHR